MTLIKIFKKGMRIPIMILLSITFNYSCQNKKSSDEIEVGQWIQLFNGEDIEDWKVKISKHDLNENFANTFRVEDGMMKVRYEGYDAFDRQYGHIFYNKPFSHYILRVEYRFVGEQPKGGEGWAFRNSGAMLHCQDPATMLKDQDFPISIEGQLLGGDGINERTTSNLCTPGTNVVINGEVVTEHCVESTSKTYHGDQWVIAEFMVLGDSVVHHIMEGKSVITYFQPQMGGGFVNPVDPEIKKDGQLLSSGFISLQSESHPIDFRKVELYDLAPYQNDAKRLNSVLEQIGFGDF